MKQIRNTVENIVLAIVVFMIITSIAGCKFTVWRLVHPEAPGWTFFFGG